MVSAELATAVGALVPVLVVSISAIVAGLDQVRCADAARVAARALARGESAQTAQAVAAQAAPQGARFVMSEDADVVRVTVRSPLRGPVGALLQRDVTGEAVGMPESPQR